MVKRYRWRKSFTIDHDGKVDLFSFLEQVLQGQEKNSVEKSLAQLIQLLMTRGGVWVKRKKTLRVYDPHFQLKGGDRIEVNYDSSILHQGLCQGSLLATYPEGLEGKSPLWSLWYKPAGALAQGTEFGDHGSLLRQVEKNFSSTVPTFLIHRLDREASGMMVLAHEQKVAAHLNEQWKNNQVKKIYQVEVKGKVNIEREVREVIETPLEGKQAITLFQSVTYNKERNVSLLLVQIKTGRNHQIRRHMESIGHPVMGDPLYGRHNKNKDGLKLVATTLSFLNPLTGEITEHQLPQQWCLF